MASSFKKTGGAGLLSIYANETTLDAANNRSLVEWSFWLKEDTPSNTTWYGSPIPASVNVGSGSVIEWEGSFMLDWRGAGQTDQQIASGSTWVSHLADGSMPSIGVAGSIGDTHTSGAGGPTTVIVTLALTTLKVVPGTPTGLTATRVSDTQIGLSWSQTSASNGQPTSNTIQQRVNGGAWETVVTISPSTSATVGAEANQKIEYRVRGNNSAGSSAWSSVSAPVYTTPAAPTGVSAVKNASLNIVVSWTPHVSYSEHEHQVWHGTVSGGVTTWDGSPLATVTAGTSTYTHVSPSSGQVHVYRVRAKAGSLYSTYGVSSAVQLLAPPNKPTIPALPQYADKAAAFVLTWTHNPVDSTPQRAYEVQYSTNGGSSWSTTGKVTSTTSSRSFAGGTYSAGVTLTVRVRTWGQHTSGGSDGTGASPWSDTRAVTFKTKPTATIVTPGSTVSQAVVAVQLGFSQPEGASFVSATVELVSGSTVLESKQTTNLSTTLSTRVADGGSYTVRATVLDSNGLTSSQASKSFTVAYLSPVAAAVSLTYLEAQGRVQVGLTIPSPGAGEAAAVAVTVTRTIDGVSETIVEGYPAASSLTFLDTTPTIQGTNSYTVTTISLDGSETDVTGDVPVAEEWRCFLSKGAGFADAVVFGYNLSFTASPSVDQRLVKAAGRVRPIGLYGRSGDLVVKGSATWVEGEGSTPDEIEAIFSMPGVACYRDPSGRRVFGQVSGSVVRGSSRAGEVQFTVTETSRGV